MLAFHPGMPDPDNFPFNTWSKLLSLRVGPFEFDEAAQHGWWVVIQVCGVVDVVISG
ncbi:hypothetical protein [Mesorhizobium temperatum]|uniref:hypothetical protein n=1 Tax=Mesorhizobium temperatum TaxID=241416 RepID=UPI00142D78D1|nr:hypothetical protein [Mesorhizobium temperatum]